jgi:cell division protein FtsL
MAASSRPPTQPSVSSLPPGQVLSPQPPFGISPAQLTIVVVCVVSVYFVVGFYGKTLESYRIGQRAEQVQRQVAALEARNRELQAQVAYLSTDSYVETAARDKLGLVKPGDQALIVLPEKPEVAWVEGPPATPDNGRALAEFGHVADWLALFFGQPAR